MSPNKLINRKIKKVTSVYIILFLFCIIAFRYETGNDWFNYKAYYFDNDFLWEKGFSYINYVFQDANYPFFFLTVFLGTITFILRIKFLLEFSPAILISLFYYLSNAFFLRDFSNLKQALATGILYLGVRALLNEKRFLFILVVIVAYFFHTSAIIFILLLVVPEKKINGRILILLMVFTFIIGQSGLVIKLMETVLSAFTGVNARVLLKANRYMNYANDTTSGSILVPFIKKMILLIPFIFFRKSAEKKSMHYNAFLNYTVLGYLILNVLGSPQLSQFRRMVTYFDGFEMILVPAVFLGIKKKSISLIFYVFIVILSFGKLYKHLDTYQMNYVPYKTIWRHYF